jgi:phage FluMu protein Com
MTPATVYCVFCGNELSDYHFEGHLGNGEVYRCRRCKDVTLFFPPEEETLEEEEAS